MKAYFSKIFEILNSFQQYLGFKMYLALIFSAVASVIDGLGIALLMPLITLISGKDLNEGNVIDVIISKLLSSLNFPTDSIVGILVLLSCIFIFKGLILFSALYSINHLKAVLLKQLKNKILDKMRRTNVQTYIQRGSGHFVNLLNEQANRSIMAFHALSHLIIHALNILIYLTLAFSIAWRFGVNAMILGVFIVQLFRRVNNRVQQNSVEISENNELNNQSTINLIVGFKYLTATAQLSQTISYIKDRIIRLKELERKQGILSAFTQSIREPLVVVTLSAIILFQVEYLGQEVTAMLVSIVLFYRCMNSILQMQGYLQNTLETYGSFVKVNGFLNDNETVVQSGIRDNYQYGLDAAITLDNVSVDYGESQILKDVSFRFEEKKVYCLLGKSGSGKTTLVDAMLGIAPLSSGVIYLPIFQEKLAPLEGLRHQVGYVSQESILFDCSICENISGKTFEELSEIERKNVRDALQSAGFDDFEKTFKDGLNTNVGERGTSLSGGQKQRIFLARELYRKPKILILDEATSALDQTTEESVNSNLLALKGKITIILITHRLKSIANADEILILDNGQIKTSGSFTDLNKSRDGYVQSHLVGI